MKKILKRGLSLVLVLVMMTGLMPVTAFAAVDSSGRPKDVNNTLVLSIYTGSGFPGEPAVYGTSDYKNINSKFAVKSGATFASSAKDQLDWEKINKDIVNKRYNTSMDITYLLYNNGFDPDAQAEMSGAELDAVASELGVVLRSYLLDFIENSLISRGLQYYHLVDRPTQNAPAEDVQQSPIAAGWNTSRTYPNFFSIQPGYENHGRCAVVFFFVTIHSPLPNIRKSRRTRLYCCCRS